MPAYNMTSRQQQDAAPTEPSTPRKVRASRRMRRGGAPRFGDELVLAVAHNAAKERLAETMVAAGALVPASPDWKKGRQWHLDRVRAMLSDTGARKAVGFWVRLRILGQAPDNAGVRAATYERVSAWVTDLVAEVLLSVDEVEREGNLVEWLCSSAAVPALWGKAITTHRGAVLVASVPGLGYAVVPAEAS
jgi:hypothetical protein